MKNIRFLRTISLILLAFTCISYTVIAQSTAQEMASRMTRGINMGNTFDAENYEGGWAPIAKEAYFDAYKDAGFQCIRIPITWGAQMSKYDSTPRISNEAPYTIQPEFLKRIDSVVNWSLERGFVTVINIHHDSWLKSRHLFDERKERFYSLWEQLAEHYKDYPEELLFEIVNEPHHSTDGEEDGLTVEQLDGLNKKTLSIIRKTNPTRVTIYTGPTWSGLHDLKKITPPVKNDKYLMATYHSYSPWSFAGEGIGSWGTDKDKKAMEQEFIDQEAYGKEFNVPVFIGEYGCDHRATYNERMLHYAYYVENIQKYKVAATAWDDGGYLFKVYDRDAAMWDDAKDILVNYGPTSPNELSLKVNDGLTITIDWKNRADNISKVTIERRVGRDGNFDAIKTIDAAETYTDETKKHERTYYYYRVVNELSDGSKLISYPRRMYLP